MTSDEIKQMYSMRDIIERYGFTPNRSGFICCPFHKEKTASMKIYKDSYHCFGCGASGDQFTFIEDMDNLTFREAYELLGGTYEQSFSATYKQEHAMKEREKKDREDRQHRLKARLNLNLISAYRTRIAKTEPFSEEWCYCQNELVKQIALFEYLNEKR